MYFLVVTIFIVLGDHDEANDGSTRLAQILVLFQKLCTLETLSTSRTVKPDHRLLLVFVLRDFVEVDYAHRLGLRCEFDLNFAEKKAIVDLSIQ